MHGHMVYLQAVIFTGILGLWRAFKVCFDAVDPILATLALQRGGCSESSDILFLLQAHVLGDNRTVLISEDGTNDAFYKFVADVAGDLSAGG